MEIEQFKNKFGIVGKSKEIRDIADIIMQVASSDISVLIYGESGVGKEVIAKAIHGYSNRANENLVSVNCGAIPEGILESELFGHKKGSFTGAIETRKGYFEMADKGTLFLDEIAEMPLSTQVKLLRAIETKEFMVTGSETITKVDVRFIAATNKNLQNEVASKKFRDDLYFRLKAVTLEIPPLRKRKVDIEELIHFFLNKFAEDNNIPLPTINYEAIDYLREYPWPGNIRELKNTVETAAALSKSGILTKANFVGLLTNYQPDIEVSRNIPVHIRKSTDEVEREFIYRALFELKKDILEIKDILLNRDKIIEHESNDEDIVPVEELEKNAIIKALEKTKWNKRLAAQLLNINERTFYRKLKDYNIE
jgi:DNA-binding NtrC family response regulator